MIEVDELITEMQTVKAAYPSLSIMEVLKIFEIKSMRELTISINLLRFRKNG